MAVVLHYRSWPSVRETLDALLEQVPAEAVVIVDNASNDGSTAHIRNAYPDCRLVEASDNLGYGAGMNLGVRHTTGDVLLLTQDCVLSPGAIERLELRLTQYPELGVVGPLLADARSPDVIFSAGGVLEAGARQLHRRPPNLRSADLDRPWIDTAWLDGACLLVRRAVLDRRRFDEGYFLYFEDVEFCVRVGRDGWRIGCVPGALASQTPGVSFAAPALWTRNRLRFVWRNARLHFASELISTTCDSGRSIRSKSGRLRLRGISALVTREDPVRLYSLRGQ